MKPFQFLLLAFTLLLLTPAARAQNLFSEGDVLSDRTYNTDNGPTNSQLTLDFPIAQAGVLQNILTWGEHDNDSMSGLDGIGQSFMLYVLRPLNSTNYQVVFATGYLTVTNVGTNTFSVSGTPFGMHTNDVVAHYGRGIPFNNGTGGPSSVYIAVNLPPPLLGTTITVPGPVYTLYNDGGRNYAIQVVALGQPYVVTATNDSGPGSLRQAVLDSAAFASASTIEFATNVSGQTIALTNGQIVLSNNVTIDASALASGIQIDGSGNSRIFSVNSGVTVVLNSLTITNGNASGPAGGFTSPGGDGLGGGIYNAGTLTVNKCVLANNNANGGPGGFPEAGGDGDGGGIYNAGTLTLTNSTFVNNNANGGGGAFSGNGGNAFGGGIYNASGGLTVNNSTLANNNANGGVDGGGAVAGNGFGGGIYISSGAVTLDNSTFANNSGVGGTPGFNSTPGNGGGGGIYSSSGALIANNCTVAKNNANGGGSATGGGILNASATINLTNCIVAGNAPLLGDMSGSFTGSSNLVNNANPLVAPLANYGGTTQTMPPEPGSPAIDAGNNSVTSFLHTDQRGLPRLSGARVDIGAVELQAGEAYPIVLNTMDSGPGSLRQTIASAPNNASVIFSPNLSGHTILLTNGQIVLSATNVIDATALPAGIQINGGGAYRIFDVPSGGFAVLSGLTITNGNPGAGNFGGAIFVGGILKLIDCTLAGNQSAQGGAIENEGTAVLYNCTLTANSSPNNGGAIDNNSGPLYLFQCTVTANSSGGAGGGVANYNNTLAMTNCIVAGNSGNGADIYNFPSSSVNAGGTNIVQSYVNMGTFTGAASLINQAPLLDSLANYGGPAPTMPPLRGSPAIDGGSTAAIAGDEIPTDERGYPRISGLRVDIGAVEVQIAKAPFLLTNLTPPGRSNFGFDLPNLVGGSFTVFATTNLALPLNAWSNLGPVPEMPLGSGVFQFTDPQRATFPQRFYRVSSP